MAEVGDPDSPYARIIVAAREIQHHISIRAETLGTIGDMVGCSTQSKLVNAVKTALTHSNRIQELEATERRLSLPASGISSEGEKPEAAGS